MNWEEKAEIREILVQSGEMTTDQIVSTIFPEPMTFEAAQRAHVRTYRALVWMRKWKMVESKGTRGNNLTWRAI